jgi:protein-S-isoprenylcysteine O-methyltransferase Ste14
MPRSRQVLVVRDADYWVFAALWVGWALYWFLAARQVKPIARRESVTSRLSHVLPLTIAAALMMNPNLRVPGMNRVLVAHTPVSFAIGVVLTVAGLWFAVWARRILGANWSAIVTVKQDHALITTGPYAWVRHPIYTGLLLALAGTAIAIGQVRAALGFVIALLAILHKTRIEERVMLEQFGDVYRAYRARVPRLIPFL